ncbi:unnamed protein product [Camellia sinensis]
MSAPVMVMTTLSTLQNCYRLEQDVKRYDSNRIPLCSFNLEHQIYDFIRIVIPCLNINEWIGKKIKLIFSYASFLLNLSMRSIPTPLIFVRSCKWFNYVRLVAYFSNNDFLALCDICNLQLLDGHVKHLKLETSICR